MRRIGLSVALLALIAALFHDWGATTSSAEPQSYTVLIEGMKFSPVLVRIQASDTVVFRNVDLVPHTVTEREAKSFDSGMINRNETWKFSPTTAGTFRYRCLYHPDMSGTIIVENKSQPRPVSSAAR